jgi:cytochrome c-type biogenesis protein CcmH
MAFSDLSLVGLAIAAVAVTFIVWAGASSWSTLAVKSRSRLIFGGVLAAATLPVLAAGLYVNATDRAPSVARSDWTLLPPEHPAITPQQALADVETMTARLAERLETEPNDAEGWRMLGWSYFHANRFADSIAAYGRAIALRPDSAHFRSAQAEAMVRADGEEISERARLGFAAALERDPRDVTARFYVALAKLRAGDRKGALDGWLALYADVPTSEPLSEELRERIGDLAKDLGVDPGPLMPKSVVVSAPSARIDARPGPSAEDVRNAEQLSAEDRHAMIVGMVDRLAVRLDQNPRDPDGWIRLARSRKVLGDVAAATQALQRAYAVFEDSPAVRSELEQASSELGLGRIRNR